VQALIARLCAEVGHEALPLVSAFGIPDHLLAAPIASDWVKYNEVDNKGEIVDNPAW